MGDEKDDERDRHIEREIRNRRGFSLGDAIGREGGNYLKGASPVPRGVQAHSEISMFVGEHTMGALRTALEIEVRGSETIIGKHHDVPLNALVEIIERLLGDEKLLHAFVRSVDFEWGKQMFERPHFQKAGQKAHPDDEHTHESVAEDLRALLQTTREAIASGGS